MCIFMEILTLDSLHTSISLQNKPCYPGIWRRTDVVSVSMYFVSLVFGLSWAPCVHSTQCVLGTKWEKVLLHRLVIGLRYASLKTFYLSFIISTKFKYEIRTCKFFFGDAQRRPITSRCIRTFSHFIPSTHRVHTKYCGHVAPKRARIPGKQNTY